MNLKVMTWNVENLFLPDPGTESAYNTKLIALARVINANAPDIIALQEVGGTEALEDLLKKLDGTWEFVLSKFPDDRGIRVGFIAKQKLLVVEDIVELPKQLVPLQTDDKKTVIRRAGRGALAISLRVGNTTIRFVTAHLKSKLLSYPGNRFQPRDEDEHARYGAYALYRRAAEAVTVRTYCNKYLDNKGQTTRLVLLGDMNDEPQAATSQILVGPGGSEIGTSGQLRPDKGDGYRMFNTAPLLPEKERFSRIYRGHRELVDHIYLSHALLRKIKAGSVQSPVAVKLPSITDDPNARPKKEASDHSPLVITLSL